MNIDRLATRAKERLFDKEFFFDLLNSAATRRDAKAYLSRLRSPEKLPPSVSQTHSKPHIKRPSHGVNLGGFFGHGRAVEDRPVFTQYNDVDPDIEYGETVHVALVKVAVPQEVDDTTMEGVAQTLSQLARLSMIPCVVVDPRPGPRDSYADIRLTAAQQANRLVDAIEKYRGARARRLDSLLSLSVDNVCNVFSRKQLLRPLREGRIPVVLPIAYSESTQQAVIVPADEALLALTKELAGLMLKQPPGLEAEELAARYKALQKQISVDRVIILDPCGAITSPGSQGRAHVFINMDQEYDDTVNELCQYDAKGVPYSDPSASSTAVENNSLGSLPAYSKPPRGPTAVHLQNLKLLRSILSLLPPSSSAIITTPDEASRSSRISRQVEAVSNVGTRRQKNPLIHNVLTDKPAQSSSLPLSRLGLATGSASPVSSTFVKKGMPLTILPDPRIDRWTPSQPRVNLNDPRIDLGRLVHLIEDSFNRKLDVSDYLNRVNDRIAGLIIAGNYEGGALLTWETPPGASDTDTDRLVPYLDKFAVLKRSQGAGGVADIVFNAMVRGCFPDGVCWRSRRDNPVNKWYFERARGTWKIPDTNWAMFWTTPGVEMDSSLFRDYEGVCKSVQPSWADKKAVLD